MGSSSSSRSERHISACARLSRIRQPPEKLRDRIAVARVAKAEARRAASPHARAPRSRRCPRSGGASSASVSPSTSGSTAAAASAARARASTSRELAIAVQHELDRRRAARRRLLRDVRDRPCRRQRNVAGIRVELAPQQREQARLAAAVGADQADLVPGVHREIRAFEQALRAAREREVGDADQASKELTRGKRREEAEMRGASSRGTGVYTLVHEDPERTSNDADRTRSSFTPSIRGRSR